MSVFFLYHPTTRPTGSVLGEALGVPHGTRPPSDRVDVLIRWGSRETVAYRPSFFTLNPIVALERATDKLASLELLRNRGVVVPPFSTNYREMRGTFLGRAVHHTRGQDIKLYLQHGDAERDPSDYYVSYIPTAREYRVRVVGTECVRISEKVLTDPSAYTPWIRNYEHGHTFVSPRTRLNTFQEALAVASVTSLGLDFGAVDLVVGDDGNTYILEVNTAPALAPMSAGAMLGGMVRLISDRTEGRITLEPEYDVLTDLSNTDDGDTEDDNDSIVT